MPLHRKLFLIILCLILTACVSRTRNSDIVNEQFFTEIKGDDSKMFVYIGNFKRASNKLKFEQQQANAAGAGQRALRSAQRKQESNLLRSLEYKLEMTGYCREGYFILNQYIQFGTGEIRGECQESATAADRALFGK